MGTSLKTPWCTRNLIILWRCDEDAEVGEESSARVIGCDEGWFSRAYGTLRSIAHFAAAISANPKRYVHISREAFASSSTRFLLFSSILLQLFFFSRVKDLLKMSD